MEFLNFRKEKDGLILEGREERRVSCSSGNRDSFMPEAPSRLAVVSCEEFICYNLLPCFRARILSVKKKNPKKIVVLAGPRYGREELTKVTLDLDEGTFARLLDAVKVVDEILRD